MQKICHTCQFFCDDKCTKILNKEIVQDYLIKPTKYLDQNWCTTGTGSHDDSNEAFYVPSSLQKVIRDILVSADTEMKDDKCEHYIKDNKNKFYDMLK